MKNVRNVINNVRNYHILCIFFSHSSYHFLHSSYPFSVLNSSNLKKKMKNFRVWRMRGMIQRM